MPRPERPVDPEGDALQRFAYDLRKLREAAGSPGYRELARRAHYSATTLAQAARGEKLPSLAVVLAYVQVCDGDTATWRTRWRALADELSPNGVLGAGSADPGRGPAPYVGLAAYEEQDADRFFGRAPLIKRLTARLDRQRLHAVVGPSGSGKSSLLRAGLLPALRAATTSNGALLITPGAQPLRECARRLSVALGSDPDDLLRDFTENPRELGRTTGHIVAKQSADAEFLLIVDQFEEVFTLCHDDEERDRFVSALLTAAESSSSRTRVVLGIRADFYGHCAQYSRLVEALDDAQTLVGPMTTDELRQVITQPAIRANCAVETALVARLIADATGQPGVLPLLSHALLETWRHRRGNTLTLSGYEAAGGLDRAISRSAERTYSEFNSAQQALARQLFMRLTALGDGTEDTRRRIQPTEFDADDPDIAVVLDRLAEARLLTLDRDSVEITHEALIRSWPRLRRWLTQDRDGLRTHRELTNAIQTWAALDRDPGALYRGTRLALAKDWANNADSALSLRERQFLEASVAAEEAEQSAARRHTRRLRRLVALLSILLLVATAATGYALSAEGKATEQRNIALSQNVARQTAALRVLNPALAAQLSLAAYRLAPTAETRSSLVSAFASPYATKVSGATGAFNDASFSPDGRTLGVGSDDRTVRLLDVTRPHHPETVAVLAGLSADVEAVSFSADGRWLAAAGHDGIVRLWDITNPRQPTLTTALAAHSAPVHLAEFSPDSRTVATASADGTARLWDVTDARRPVQIAQLTGHGGALGSVAFSPDGRTLATGSDDHTVRLWNIGDPRRPHELTRLPEHTEDVESVVFSPDGRRLATAGFDRTARLWDVTEPAAPVALGIAAEHTDTISSVAFSPDGLTLATSGWDHTTRLWDITNPSHVTALTTLFSHTNTVWSVEFSPDGNTLATASADRSVRLTDLPDPALAWHADAVRSVAFSPTGRTAASASRDGTVRLWDVTNPLRPRTLPVLTGHTAPVRTLAFSADGRTLATGSADQTVRLWDLADPRHPAAFPAPIQHDGPLRSVAFSPAGATVAVAGDSQIVSLWDLSDPARPTRLAKLADHTDFIPAVAFSGDGDTLAVAMSNGVRLVDVTEPRRPKLIATLNGHLDRVLSVAFSPDSQSLVSTSLDRTARLWDVTDLDDPRPMATISGHTGAVSTAAFSPDGRTLATGSFDRTATLWNVADLHQPRHTATLTGHTDRVQSVAFSQNGRTLITGGDDRGVRLWELKEDRIASRICELANPPITRAEWDQYLPGLTYQPPCAQG